MFSVAPVAPRLWWHDIYIDKIQLDDLEEGYKVVRAVKETIMLYKINRYTIR